MYKEWKRLLGWQHGGNDHIKKCGMMELMYWTATYQRQVYPFGRLWRKMRAAGEEDIKWREKVGAQDKLTWDKGRLGLIEARRKSRARKSGQRGVLLLYSVWTLSSVWNAGAVYHNAVEHGRFWHAATDQLHPATHGRKWQFSIAYYLAKLWGNQKAPGYWTIPLSNFKILLQTMQVVELFKDSYENLLE